MDPKKIERINELARKKKETGLTEAELAEQAELKSILKELDKLAPAPEPKVSDGTQMTLDF